MPELPDLVYIVKSLAPRVTGRAITSARVKQPVVIRMLEGGGFAEALTGRRFLGLERRGPFLVFDLDRGGLATHLMLSGHWELSAGTRATAHECFALRLDDGYTLRYGDETRMGRVYVGEPAAFAAIPGFASQGVDPLSAEFTAEAFARAISGKRCQVRVLVMDQTLISAVGNAYADEILFAAGLHPKTRCHELSPPEVARLHAAIVDTLRWGVEQVERAGKPVEVKVRGHMRVRNRKGEPCPVCGATIRRAAVLGFDSFFCPSCQPEKSGRGIPWDRKPAPPQ